MTHYRVTVGHHLQRSSIKDRDGTHIAMITASRSAEHNNGDGQPHREEFFMLLVESRTAQIARQMATAMRDILIPLPNTTDGEQKDLCGKLAELVEQYPDDDLHASLIGIKWPTCTMVFTGANRHLFIRGGFSQILTPLTDGRTRAVTVGLRGGDWVLAMANSTRLCLSLSTENILVRKYGNVHDVCQAITKDAAQYDPENDHAAVALHPIETI